MTEIEQVRAAITSAYALGRIVVANPNLTAQERQEGERSVQLLLSVLFNRLNRIEHNYAKLPDSIKSDY